jgi:hypothetical protein
VAMFAYSPVRRLSVAETRSLPVEKECLFCKGGLLRVAERWNQYPYAWMPIGWACNECPHLYVDEA